MATDRSDPAVRAAARLALVRTRERRVRTLTALVCAVLAPVGVLAAEPITGDPGATIGAVVGAVLLAALAVAAWPWRWTEAESIHRELESIWHEARHDAGERVTWERYAAWAEAHADRVQLMLVRCAPACPQAAGAPSPYSRELRQLLDAEDVEQAAAAMEALRDDAAGLELEAERRYRRGRLDAARQPRGTRLDATDRAPRAVSEAAEAQARSDLAEQRADERRAQADAVARALRRR